MSEGWSRAARGFEPVSRELFGPATEPFFAFAGLRRGMSVLDAACGPGTSTLLAARRVGPRGAVLGVDSSEPMLALARKAARRAPGVSFSRMDAHALAAPDGAFDAVVCHLGLMLFARPAAALKELARAAKPGAPVSCLVLGAERRMPFTGLVAPLAPELHAFGEPGALEAAFAAAGLREVKVRRLRGRFSLPSPRAYLRLVLEGFGRVGPVIRAMPPGARRAFERELLEKASAFRRASRLEIPYEFAMARGRKP